jgi:hypothetical protein
VCLPPRLDLHGSRACTARGLGVSALSPAAPGRLARTLALFFFFLCVCVCFSARIPMTMGGWSPEGAARFRFHFQVQRHSNTDLNTRPTVWELRGVLQVLRHVRAAWSHEQRTRACLAMTVQLTAWPDVCRAIIISTRPRWPRNWLHNGISCDSVRFHEVVSLYLVFIHSVHDKFSLTLSQGEVHGSRTPGRNESLGRDSPPAKHGLGWSQYIGKS